MPLSTETVKNKPLTGKELMELILADAIDLLGKDGLLGSSAAFGKVSYDLTVRLHLDNPTYPEHKIQGGAKRHPGVKEGSTPLLDADLESEIALEVSRHRDIISPNATRIDNGIPLTIEVKEGEHIVEKKLDYTGQIEVSVPKPLDTDTSKSFLEEVRKGRAKK